MEIHAFWYLKNGFWKLWKLIIKKEQKLRKLWKFLQYFRNLCEYWKTGVLNYECCDENVFLEIEVTSRKLNSYLQYYIDKQDRNTSKFFWNVDKYCSQIYVDNKHYQINNEYTFECWIKNKPFESK